MLWNKIKVNSFIEFFAASNQPLLVGTAFSGWLPTFGDGGGCVNSGQIIGLFFCLDQADQFCQYQTSHINILTSTRSSIFFSTFIKSLFQFFDQFIKPVQFIIYCTIQLISSRLIKSAPWPLGWLHLPSMVPGTLLQDQFQVVLCLPDGRRLGPHTAVQIPCLLCGTFPRSFWFHFIIGLVRYSIFLLVFGTSE